MKKQLIATSMKLMGEYLLKTDLRPPLVHDDIVGLAWLNEKLEKE